LLTFEQSISEIVTDMKQKEEYVDNRRRDWIIFGISSVLMVGLLVVSPEWVWVIWPLQFTALAGALGRL
jgi:hypothetical protein